MTIHHTLSILNTFHTHTTKWTHVHVTGSELYRVLWGYVMMTLTQTSDPLLTVLLTVQLRTNSDCTFAWRVKNVAATRPLLDEQKLKSNSRREILVINPCDQSGDIPWNVCECKFVFVVRWSASMVLVSAYSFDIPMPDNHQTSRSDADGCYSSAEVWNMLRLFQFSPLIFICIN